MVIAYTDTPLQERPRKQAGFLISSDLPAGEVDRDKLMAGYVYKIAEANADAPMFSHIGIRFEAVELKTIHPVFKWAEEAALGLIAADMGRIGLWASSPDAYLDYIRRAIDLGIQTFRVDNAQRLTIRQLKCVLVDVPGVRWVVSTTPEDAATVGALLQCSDADAKLEVQTYRHGHSVHYVEKWLNEIPMWSVGFEAFRTLGGKVATPYEIAWMGQHVIAARKSSVMVCGHDDHTNYLMGDDWPDALGAQWKVLQSVMSAWWDDAAATIDPAQIRAAAGADGNNAAAIIGGRINATI